MACSKWWGCSCVINNWLDNWIIGYILWFDWFDSRRIEYVQNVYYENVGVSMSRGQRRSVCRYFSTSGKCLYGDQCQFLHVRGAAPQPRPHPVPRKTEKFTVPSSKYNVQLVLFTRLLLFSLDEHLGPAQPPPGTLTKVSKDRRRLSLSDIIWYLRFTDSGPAWPVQDSTQLIVSIINTIATVTIGAPRLESGWVQE